MLSTAGWMPAESETIMSATLSKTAADSVRGSNSVRSVQRIYKAPPMHWVGDGFAVRSLFSYDGLGKQEASPFLMLDYGAPRDFTPSSHQRGVGVHPHRGFETVTVAYHGEIAHRDSTGQGGIIGPGDVQWMTAASGILHEEFHSPSFAQAGGVMEMAQLWVNLPKAHKMAPPAYQPIVKQDMPVVALPDNAGQGSAGTVRVIAGQYDGADGVQAKGPATTFTPIDLWDISLKAGKAASFSLPEGHTAMLVARRGSILVNGTDKAAATELVLLSREGVSFTLEAQGEAGEDAEILLMSGQPIDEPVVGYGPFVMTSPDEIRQAIMDFQDGKFGRM